jgi:hypothetical protein
VLLLLLLLLQCIMYGAATILIAGRADCSW